MARFGSLSVEPLTYLTHQADGGFIEWITAMGQSECSDRGDRVAARAIVMQQKTGHPVQFEIAEQTVAEFEAQ